MHHYGMPNTERKNYELTNESALFGGRNFVNEIFLAFRYGSSKRSRWRRASDLDGRECTKLKRKKNGKSQRRENATREGKKRPRKAER